MAREKRSVSHLFVDDVCFFYVEGSFRVVKDMDKSFAYFGP